MENVCVWFDMCRDVYHASTYRVKRTPPVGLAPPLLDDGLDVEVLPEDDDGEASVSSTSKHAQACEDRQ